MPITFECECGEQISVPDGMEGRIALCATCRKTQRIPGEASGDDASAVSGLFREALAAFGEAEEGDGAQATREQAEVPSEADTRLMDGQKRSGGSAPAGGPSKPEPEEARQPEPKPEPEAEEPLKLAPPDDPSHSASSSSDSDEVELADDVDSGDAPDVSEDAHATSEGPALPKEPASRGGKPKGGGGPATKDALPVEYAAKVLEKREIEKAIRREGEPDSPAGAFEPKDVERHGNVMKFHCRCGKRISVPVKANKTIGRCPKCGARLVVPRASDAKSPTEAPAAKSRDRAKPAPEKRARDSKDAKDTKEKPRSDKGDSGKSDSDKARAEKERSEKARSDEARAENVRRATAEVADRLRKRGSKGGKGGKGARPGAKKGGLVRASGPARVMAAAADGALIAAALVGSFYALGGGEWTAAGVVPTAVLGASAWCANRLVVQWIFGSSIGMMAGGVRLARPDGRPLSFGGNLVRALAGILLLPLAPIALGDKNRRTPADRATGTVVLSSR